MGGSEIKGSRKSIGSTNHSTFGSFREEVTAIQRTVESKSLKEFKDSIGAWRAWSDVEEGVHLAFYEFENIYYFWY